MKRVSIPILVPKGSVGFLPELGGMCLFLLKGSLVHARERAVLDAVRDDSGQPLLAARILAKTPTNGVISAVNGTDFTHTIYRANKLNQI